MKKWMYLASLLAVIAILTILYLYSEKLSAERQLQNAYAQQLANASEEMTQLQTALFQASILKNEQALNEQLLQIFATTSNVKQSLAAVPILQQHTTDWMHMMTDIQSLAANALQQSDYSEWNEKAPQLASHMHVLDEEWAVLNANFFSHTSTLKDYNEVNPSLQQLTTSLKSVSEKSFPVTASESDYEKKKKLEHINLPPITKQQAEQKLFELFPHLKGATVTVSLNKDDAPYEFYHIQFVRGSKIGYIDILKNGGLLLSMLIDRPILEQQISQQEARQAAEQFVQQHMPDAEFVEVRENHEVWHYVFARTVNGVVVYPDALQLKVAKDRPEILGISALEYVQQERVDVTEAKPIDWQQFLQPTAKVQESRLVVIEGKQFEPILCYEALVTSKADPNHTYRLYIEAETLQLEKIELIN